MFDFEIAFYLYKMSRIQKIFLNSQYRAKAYYSAALAIDAYSNYVEGMYNKGLLREIPYVGSKIERSIVEIIETGQLQELQEYEKRFGIIDYSLILSYGLPEKLLVKILDLSIRSVDELLDPKCFNRLQMKLTEGEKGKLNHFLEEFQRNKDLYLLSYGKCLGEDCVSFLSGIKGVNKAKLVGGINEYREKIQRIEIFFEYVDEWEYFINSLKECELIENILGSDYPVVSGMTRFGIPFLFTCVGKINCSEWNSKSTIANKIKGDLHAHTIWTDGIHSMEQMAQEAWKRGYQYLAITDHTANLRFANGLSEDQALSQIEEIRKYNECHEEKILAGIEVDILADGSLDFCNEVLEQFDFVIAAIHTHMEQDSMSMYKRLERALSNPYVNILAHPTGRLLGRPGVLFSDRKPYNIGVEDIIELCKKYSVDLELNCFPERLDLNSEGIMGAVSRGVKISLGTDAHSIAHLCNIDYGVGILDRLLIDSNMILNTYSYEELLEYFKKKRPISRITEQKATLMSKKDFRYYFSNNEMIMQGKKSIVGIDLTGSEDKESGWAYLHSTRVECMRIKTDDEIIASIQRLNPDVISIDSPLAFPKGRCCSRKNCKCAKYGIMRKSERMLRHFGITVYPCLIDSMVNLTTRGMALAKRLRSMGYVVIESYPGVAQDVLKIPRKGKTVEQFKHLKQGLASFGITGDLIENPDISHDEVDAITSALVGYFYLNDQYIGLGNDDEDYLIVPRIQEELINKRIIIGLSGETGSGKTTVAEYLQFKYGLKYFRYSEIIAKKYNTSDKKELQIIGAKIAEDSQKQRELTHYMSDIMDKDKSYVVDGLRHWEDYEELKKKFGEEFVFIYLDCRYLNRYKRYNKLHFDSISKEEFEEINNHDSEKDIVLLNFKADYTIDNNRGFKELRMQMDDIVTMECGGKS